MERMTAREELQYLLRSWTASKRVMGSQEHVDLEHQQLDEQLMRKWRRVVGRYALKLKEPFACDGCIWDKKDIAKVDVHHKSLHLIFQHYEDETGKNTEHMCYDCWCHRISTGGRTWFLAKGQGWKKKKSGTKIMRAFCGEASRTSSLKYVIIIKYGHLWDACLVFLLTRHPFISARIFWKPSPWPERSLSEYRRQSWSRMLQKGNGTGERRSIDKLSAIWENWRNKHLEAGVLLFWYEIGQRITMCGVHHPGMPEGFQLHINALTLAPEDLKAQRAVYNVASLASGDHQMLGLLIAECDCTWSGMWGKLSTLMSQESWSCMMLITTL